jgi:hypothetical protein
MDEHTVNLTPRDQPFTPGQRTAVIEVTKQRIWTLKPVTVVADGPEIVLWLAPGTPTRYPAGAQRGRHTIPRWLTGDWELTERPWSPPGKLLLTRPGDSFEVRVAPTDPQGDWYINLVEPYRRVHSGFVTMDQVLDIVIDRDLSNWRLKDEDELALAQTTGLYSQAEATAIRSTAKTVIAAIRAGTPPWNLTWTHWRPPDDERTTS